MSDPMTNLQIEDVLSSIRRLVAEGDKTRSDDDVANDQPVPQPMPSKTVKTPERLVLTPALRVSQDADDDTVDKPANDADCDTIVFASKQQSVHTADTHQGYK